MNDWTAGYVADIGYTFGYYKELNPLRVKLAFLSAGLVCPEFGTACELGFGQGISTNFHAAATLTNWSGTDFNPSQASYAQELAGISTSGAALYDESFAEFCGRADIPDFDYIGLHGIWSWISDENRQVIVDFIRRKLKVGGVLYISYNTLPGWAAFAPVRHLMTEHADIIGAEGRGILSRISDALDFAERLLATNPAFAGANPQVGGRLSKLKDQNRHYLAHEYFNRDWHPMHFSTLADWLEPAKVSYACSSHYLDHVDGVNLTTDQQNFLKEIPDAMFRESVRDFMVNQFFRRDLWVRGARRLTALERSEQIRALRVVLSMPRAEVPLKANGSLGEASMSETVYNPILDALADYKPKSLGQLEQALLPSGITLAHLLQAMLVLGGSGHVHTVQDEAVITKARKRTDKLNSYLMQKARSSNEVNYLVSPVTGGGIAVGRFAQLFLMAYTSGKKQPDEWAQYAWQILSAQGQKLLKDGKTIENDQENLAELTVQAKAVADSFLAIYKALQIV